MEVVRPSTLAKLVASVALLAGGLVLGASAARRAPHYAMVDELVAGGLDRWGDRELKVHGWIVAGTIVQQRAAQTFVLARSGKTLRVVALVPLPETARDQSELVVTGRLVRDAQGWVLVTTTVAARCADAYRSTRRSLDTAFE